MTSQQLLAELTDDPTSLGYAGMTTSQKLTALNQPRETITFTKIVDVATVMGVFTSALFRISAINEPGKTAWLQVMANIRALKEGLRPSDDSVQGLLAQGVADGVLLAGEKAYLESLGYRHGSRAEQLWGEGSVVTLNDLALIL